MKKFYLFILLLFFSSTTWAVADFYRFDNTIQKKQFESLTTTLRCLVCQNQNIAESNAPLASDLRQLVFEKIQQKQSNEEIIQFLVARYGNYILYQPPFNFGTLGLWCFPFLFALFGVIYLLLYLKRVKG